MKKIELLVVFLTIGIFTQSQILKIQAGPSISKLDFKF